MKKQRRFIVYISIVCAAVYASSLVADAFRLGVENIPATTITELKTKRIGLITNQTGQDQHGNSTAQLLVRHGLPVKTIFTPEHGFTGKTGAALEIHDAVDPLTKLPIISLYGKATGKKMPIEHVRDLDVLVFDMQDSGMRHYTYISTLFHVMQSAAEHKKPLVVLDRPNPLGWHMEGPLVDPELTSFISIAPIPLRHGMTIGELARYFNTNLLHNETQLTVIPMAHYRREQPLFCPANQILSPNIASKASCYGYSFLGLLGEIKPMDVGVGTDKAFQCILLPEAMSFSVEKWTRLQALLQQYNIQSTPYSYNHPEKKQRFIGLHLNLDQIHTVPSFKLFLTIVSFFKKEGIALDHSRFFDKAVGTSHVQKMLNNNGSLATLSNTVNKQLQEFFDKAHKTNSFLYHPHPRIVEL